MRNIFIGLVLLLVACEEPVEKVNSAAEEQQVFNSIDSMEYHFVVDPHKPFEDKVMMISDTAEIRLFEEVISGSIVKTDSCKRYNHKWYLFRKGDVFKTIYASTGNDTCKYLGWVEGGMSTYRAVSASLDSLILQLGNRLDTLP